jgi:catechol-2,3-dioxygenase
MAFEVDSMETLLAAKAKLEANGVEVLGPTNHTIFKSIYFFDPNGHRLELATNTGTRDVQNLGRGEVGHAERVEQNQTRAQACGFDAANLLD